MSPILLEPLSAFAQDASAKLKLPGEPEEQLRAPLERCLGAIGKLFGIKVSCQGEYHVQDIGRPDYAIYANGALCGYVEVKQPGKGANPARYRGHDKKQWERFQALPNILYTDGNEWALYQNGERAGSLIRLCGDVAAEGRKAVCPGDAMALEPLFRNFLTWNPVIPRDTRSLAKLVAPLCRLLREEVAACLEDADSPFRLLYVEWQTTLFPGQSPDRFADAYAQTVTFSLLLANAEGGDVLDLRNAEASLAQGHTLLSRALKIFTDNLNPQEEPASLAVLQRIVAAIPPTGFRASGKDPWLYFYEDFLAEYDPALRKDSGSYYTPVEAVQAMTRLTGEILHRRMGKLHGFASPDVLTLDPAAGTGTFLLGIIAESLAPIAKTMGEGAVAAYADVLGRQLYGFELQVGPYAVAQMRLSRALLEYGAHLPAEGPHVYLTDTLESPDLTPQFPSLLARTLSEQHKKALAIKKCVPILVCIGNPPYDRHGAADGSNYRETGGWVRWGDENSEGKYNPGLALLESFAAPVRQAGHGGHLKNLYNLYVYFWRWALWKVFEQKEDSPGIVAFITASSFLEGPAFGGMRQALRRLCEDIWVIDLGGEGRASRKEENIFNIQTPVCITIAARYGRKQGVGEVHYTRFGGSRAQKLAALAAIDGFDSLNWQNCPRGWLDPFTPAGKGDYFSLPLLKDIFPWRQSGVKAGRTWVIGTDKDVLDRRWKAIFQERDADKRSELFKNAPPSTGGRTIWDSPMRLFSEGRLKSISEPGACSCEKIAAYGYRSFDRQYILADARCIDRVAPSLWSTYSDRQIYFASLFSIALGHGPALTLSSELPDLSYFRGSFGAKDIIPLYRDAAASEPNIVPELLNLLEHTYAAPVTAEDLAAYVYAVLGHSHFTERFHDELTTREIRVPLTRNPDLFARAAVIGRRLIWLHSYGERLTPEGWAKGAIPAGQAKCVKAVSAYPESCSYSGSSATLLVGDGEFAPVSQEVYEFEVSGLKVVQSWLKYRMKTSSGRKSSPLDDIRPGRWTAEYTEGLLRLLWVLEATLAEYPGQAEMLEEILAGELIAADELPGPRGQMREAPNQPPRSRGNDLRGRQTETVWRRAENSRPSRQGLLLAQD